MLYEPAARIVEAKSFTIYMGCGDMAAVFIALANACGLKARFIHGVSDGWSRDHNAGHHMAEVFLPEQSKWLLVDPTDGSYSLDYSYRGEKHIQIDSRKYTRVGEPSKNAWAAGLYSKQDVQARKHAAANVKKPVTYKKLGIQRVIPRHRRRDAPQ